MAKSQNNLLDLDVEKLFEEHNVDEIIEIEKLLDTEIERKRKELRSMVGDRYKDVLAASDSIKSMKTISQEIVDSIDNITTKCQDLTQNISNLDKKSSIPVDSKKIEERIIISQIRLAIFMNEQIWVALDEENNLDAAQYFLLAQHIQTGLSLSKKEYINKVPLLQHIKSNLLLLKSKILEKITDKLESVETSTKETSQNLNALFLLENQGSKDLISIFIEHRKTALNTVINSPYSSVRAQICSMVKCLLTTVRLLYDCFISDQNGYRGLIWQQLQGIIGNTAPFTISKLDLPVTPLMSYLPEIIKQFRPTCKSIYQTETPTKEVDNILKEWLESTRKTVKEGLEKSLDLIPNIKGLHLTREESLKIEPPDNWDQICKESQLPDNFNIWYYFFQNLITLRCQSLITKKMSSIILETQSDVESVLESACKSDNSEADLRWYVWNEEIEDVSKFENSHLGLSMKTKGYSKNIVELCDKFDKKYLELLQDASQYLYGKDFNINLNYAMVLKDFKFKRKFMDKTDVEKHLQLECSKTCKGLSDFSKDLLSEDSDYFVTKCVILARFLQAITQLCPHFHKCCTFNNADEWLKICDTFNITSQTLWMHWIDDVVKDTEKNCQELDDVSVKKILKTFAKWDEIEIQEHTEEKVFKSQIQVPLKPSLMLNEIVDKLNASIGLKIPHSIPKTIHLKFIEKNSAVIFDRYKSLSEKQLNQKQALQFLFDIKYLTTLCIPRENVQLIAYSQEICDKFRSKIDPFDLDVFYSYLQNNVKRAVAQSQVILGCLLPSSNQLANLGVSEKVKEQDQNPNILALSTPSLASWFPLLPVSAPSQRAPGSSTKAKDSSVKSKSTPKKTPDSSNIMKHSAASIFGGLATDWFS
ncbi:unnamed protein product [Phyllotreta striolata]|uniref:Conserved oligomeric Golgi complex subunit 1 n=1 Tax=Phyllotreta striolata TaxID=444603 RepID=A0A9N9TT80_PHYSR|nr:unnamed protein product [Phyllotreta striolata]